MVESYKIHNPNSPQAYHLSELIIRIQRRSMEISNVLKKIEKIFQNLPEAFDVFSWWPFSNHHIWIRKNYIL